MMILNFSLDFRGLFKSVPQMTEKYLILSLNLVKLYTNNSKFFHIRPLPLRVPCGVQTLPTIFLDVFIPSAIYRPLRERYRSSYFPT